MRKPGPFVPTGNQELERQLKPRSLPCSGERARRQGPTARPRSSPSRPALPAGAAGGQPPHSSHSHAKRQLGLSEAAECLVACNTLPGWPSPAAGRAQAARRHGRRRRWPAAAAARWAASRWRQSRRPAPARAPTRRCGSAAGRPRRRRSRRRRRACCRASRCAGRSHRAPRWRPAARSPARRPRSGRQGLSARRSSSAKLRMPARGLEQGIWQPHVLLCNETLAFSVIQLDC